MYGGNDKVDFSGNPRWSNVAAYEGATSKLPCLMRRNVIRRRKQNTTETVCPKCIKPGVICKNADDARLYV